MYKLILELRNRVTTVQNYSCGCKTSPNESGEDTWWIFFCKNSPTFFLLFSFRVYPSSLRAFRRTPSSRVLAVGRHDTVVLYTYGTLLHGYSAPIRLKLERSRAELAFLMAESWFRSRDSRSWRSGEARRVAAQESLRILDRE